MTLKETDVWTKAFEARSEADRRAGPSWLFPLRKAGLARFAERGFPTRRHEDWRFTNVEPIARLPFLPVTEPGAMNSSRLVGLPLADLEGTRLVFVDGFYAPELSRAAALPKGARVGSLAEALTAAPSLLEHHLARQASGEENAFAALNTAFFTDGGFVHVPAGSTVEHPVHLLFFTTENREGAAVHARNLVIAEEGSAVTVVESHFAAGPHAVVVNMATELVAGAGARLEHCKFQDQHRATFHVASVHARLAKAARVWSHSILTGARLARNDIRTTLDGEGVECVLNGLYLTRDEQLADHHMVVDHAKPHGTSHEYFNGILADRSRGVFHGRILVRQEAQKTDAKQTNKNLLLTEQATVNAKPQLEIYADDVKCTHGATVGQMNEESIFYLRSRAIGLETARRMLMHAFAGEIIDRIQCDAVRTELDAFIWNRLEEHDQIAVGR